MSGSIQPYTVELDNGPLSPAWTLAVAIQAAREAETCGRTAIRIRQGTETIMEGEELRKQLE